MRAHLPSVSFLLLLLPAFPAAAQQPQMPPALDLTLLKPLKARSIGPAAMSGRIAAVASVPGDPRTVWAGAATGGLWKSTDGGVTFAPVFDEQDCAAVGAIAIDPTTPEVVWVGTGEGNPRNSASVGRGVYRTRDGGRTWQKLGLEKTERIHRILLHPRDPDTAYVAAMGAMWGENPDRGVYKTTDGGATWEKVLYVDERTGCADLAMDPSNPDKLLAGMWQYRRWPWFFKSGGPGSGLHRSVDGGRTWKKLAEEDGIPGGELGRSGFDFSHSDPRTVYALVEANKNVLLRSDDGGFKWRTVNESPNVSPRPFYFCDLRVDPANPERVYSLEVTVTMSEDGGRSFKTLAGWDGPHPDHHALWIDPLQPDRMVLGCDGGVYTSQDRGKTWRFCSNLPLGQFYHVAVDMDVPYHVYGGLQDNGSWRGPSAVWENGGIRNLHWQEVCFGDGFATLPDPQDSMQGYAMSQGGALMRWNLRTGEQKGIRPPAPEDTKLRFNWNAAIAQDPRDPATIYYGSQFVHRSRDRGESWELMSPDLTTNDPEKLKQKESGGLTFDVTAAENHCTIVTIAPSPVQAGVVWVGTDDGRVHVTRDDGATWTSVEANIPDLPKGTWCPHVEAGRHDAATAFAVFDDHRRSDWTPRVYVTRDHGTTWTSLATPELDGWCLTIEQDPVQPNLLFLGTEFGLWFTLDGGAKWHRFTSGFPTSSAMALAVHPREHDLVVGTHARSVFVVDDISPLRTLTPELMQQKLHVFPVRDAIPYDVRQTPAERFPGHGEFRGENATRGAVVTLLVNADELEHPDPAQRKARREAIEARKKAAEEARQAEAKAKGETAPAEQPMAEAPKDEAPKDHVTLVVRDTDGLEVRRWRERVQLGMNRIVWRFERNGVAGPSRELQEDPELPPGGPEVLPGDYTLTVQFQGAEQTVPLRVLADPRVDIPRVERLARRQFQDDRDALMGMLRGATQGLARARKELEWVESRLKLDPKPKTGDDPLAALRKATEEARKALDELDVRMWGPKDRKGITDDEGLMHDVWEQLGHVTRSLRAPNPTEELALRRARTRAGAVTGAAEGFLSGPFTTWRTAVEQAQALLLPSAGKPSK